MHEKERKKWKEKTNSWKEKDIQKEKIAEIKIIGKKERKKETAKERKCMKREECKIIF